MKDKFEKYIQQHRHLLDDIEPLDNEMMWKEFDRSTRPIKKIQIWRYVVAAAVVAVVGSMVYLNIQTAPSTDQIVQERLALIDPSLAEEQARLMNMIEEQNSMLAKIGINQEEFPELYNELRTIDSLQIEVIKDLELYSDKSNLIKTLLKHYAQKTRVLELMLYEFEKQESEIEYEKAKQI